VFKKDKALPWTFVEKMVRRGYRVWVCDRIS